DARRERRNRKILALQIEVDDESDRDGHVPRRDLYRSRGELRLAARPEQDERQQSVRPNVPGMRSRIVGATNGVAPTARHRLETLTIRRSRLAVGPGPHERRLRTPSFAPSDAMRRVGRYAGRRRDRTVEIDAKDGLYCVQTFHGYARHFRPPPSALRAVAPS